MKYQLLKSLFFLSFLFQTLFLIGQTDPQPNPGSDKHTDEHHPKIGLALSGGGAKGIAHIGVLKVLEEAGIRPDYVTGTSIGSIMGGLYSIGYSVEELEAMAKDIDWNYYFNDELKRTDLPIEERHYSERYQVKFGIENNKIQFPKGFIQGQKIGLLLSYLTLPAHGITDFDKFPIPFRCIATDAETGEKVIIKDGSLAKAMRASMSLPSVFEPMEIDGKILLDGGVVQNLPVQEAFDMGAEIVIAVDITSPLYKRSELKSLIQVLEQTSSYKLAESVALQRELADVVITPDILGFGTLDFKEVDSLLYLGEIAAKTQLPKILELVHVDHEPNHEVKVQSFSFPDSCKVCVIKMKGVDAKRRNTIANVMQMRIVKEYSIKGIEQRIKQLFGGQFFRDAYYELTPGAKGYELMIDADVKSGEYLQVSMNYDSDLKAAILLNGTFRNRGLNGSKLGIDIKLSENPMMMANYQVYTTSQPNFGIRINGILNHFPFYLYNDVGELDDISSMYHYQGTLNLFTSFKNSSMFSTGVTLERFAKRDDIFDKRTEDLGLNQAFFGIRYVFDTYDRELFPKEGSYLEIDSRLPLFSNIRFPEELSISKLSNFTTFSRLKYSKILKVNEKFSIRGNIDGGYIEFESDSEPNNFLSMFYLGRDLPEEFSHVEFVGLDYMEIPVSEYWMAGVKFRAEFIDNIFTSVLFNYGQYRARNYNIVNDNLVETIPTQIENIYGAGLEFGFVTPIGPGRLGTEYNLKEKNLNFVMHLGYRF